MDDQGRRRWERRFCQGERNRRDRVVGDRKDDQVAGSDQVRFVGRDMAFHAVGGVPRPFAVPAPEEQRAGTVRRERTTHGARDPAAADHADAPIGKFAHAAAIAGSARRRDVR